MLRLRVREVVAATGKTLACIIKEHTMIVKMPKWIKILLIFIAPGLLMFFGRMSYECLYLTYKNGPQMIGFSLIHLHPSLYIFMILSYFAAIIWIIIYAIWIIKVLINRNRPSGLWIFILTGFVVVFVLLLEPISKILY
jgi:hypothetical protein